MRQLDTAPPVPSAEAIASALYVTARNQYRAALNAAAACTAAGPAMRFRLTAAVDRAAARHRIAMARLDFMGHPGPDHLSDPRD